MAAVRTRLMEREAAALVRSPADGPHPTRGGVPSTGWDSLELEEESSWHPLLMLAAREYPLVLVGITLPCSTEAALPLPSVRLAGHRPHHMT